MSDWRDVVGLEGSYQVRADGVIKSMPRRVVRSDGTIQNFKGKILNSFLNSSGYLLVRLSDFNSGIRKTERVHRIVAEAFIPNPENKPEVNHKNGKKNDPTVGNLEWVTPKENRKHAWDSGLRGREHLPIKRGGDNPRAKLNYNHVIEMRKMRASGCSFDKISAKFSVCKKTAIAAIKGLTWKNIPEPPEE